MLKEILSIGGKPGLFKMVSQAKNMLIVESLTDGKRTPAFARDKVVSLGDIAIYTQTGEVPLGKVFHGILEKEDGKPVSIDPKSDNDTLRGYLAEVLPDFDRDRVYPSDIRKMLMWYNQLVSKGLTDFLPAEEDAKEEETQPEENAVKE